MANVIKLPNITHDSLVMNETQGEQRFPTRFNAKNYLDTRPENGKTEKKVTIRILPMNLDTGNPFARVHFHNVQVPQEIAGDGRKPYKSYLCLDERKNPDIDHSKYGGKCPFCEINKKAYEKSLEVTDPVEKKAWQEISLHNHSNEAVIIRCIERGHEEDGVKFWKFNLRNDKKDPYHVLMDLYNQRKKEGEENGEAVNIFDIYNGYDLTVTFTAGTPIPPPTIMDAKNSSPLSKDEEQMRAWIFDEKKWQDVFTPKDYNYLSLISEMRVPWFDKTKNMWVDKEDYMKEHKDEFSKPERPTYKNELEDPSHNEPVAKEELAKAVVVEDNNAEEDLPF